MLNHVHAIAVTAHPVGTKERLLLVLQSYCDESHDGKNERVYVVAGFLGVETEWINFTHRWTETLKGAGISAFHQSECVGQQGEFKQMDWDEREELQRKFIEIITSTHILGAPGAILLGPYNELMSRIKKARTIRPGRNVSGSLEDPYFLAFQLVVELIAKNAKTHGVADDEKLDFVFDRTHLKGRVGPLYDSILNSRTLDYVDRLGSLTFADKRDFLPLQAADILAYEHFRHIDDCMLKGKPERWQWVEVMKKVPVWHLFNRATLEKLLEQEGW